MNKTLAKVLGKIEYGKRKPESIATQSGKVIDLSYGLDEFGEYVDIAADDFPEDFKVVLYGGETGVPQSYRRYYKTF